MDEMLTRILHCIGNRHGAQKELAEHLGIHPNVITNWKNGTNKSYRGYINEIADFYEVSAEYLLTGDREALILDKAKRKLSLIVEENPSLQSGKRLNFLFDETDRDPMFVSYSLGIDQTYIDSWLQHGILPPQPIVDKILGVFQMKVGELLNDEELAAYEEENEEWGKAPSDSQNKKVPTIISESGQPVNVVKIAGRDGSFMEKRLNDKELQALKAFVDLLPDADDL